MATVGVFAVAAGLLLWFHANRLVFTPDEGIVLEAASNSNAKSSETTRRAARRLMPKQPSASQGAVATLPVRRQRAVAAGLEGVPEPPHRVDQDRPGRVVFHFLAQPQDVHVHRAVRDGALLAPNRIQQLLAAEHHAGRNWSLMRAISSRTKNGLTT